MVAKRSEHMSMMKDMLYQILQKMKTKHGNCCINEHGTTNVIKPKIIAKMYNKKNYKK
jgi:hypothetical protein